MEELLNLLLGVCHHSLVFFRSDVLNFVFETMLMRLQDLKHCILVCKEPFRAPLANKDTVLEILKPLEYCLATLEGSAGSKASASRMSRLMHEGASLV